jgi:hypothetical protein
LREMTCGGVMFAEKLRKRGGKGRRGDTYETVGSSLTAPAAGRRRGWKLCSEFLSPHFTITWDELLRV